MSRRLNMTQLAFKDVRLNERRLRRSPEGDQHELFATVSLGSLGYQDSCGKTEVIAKCSGLYPSNSGVINGLTWVAFGSCGDMSRALSHAQHRFGSLARSPTDLIMSGRSKLPCKTHTFRCRSLGSDGSTGVLRRINT